MNDGSTDDTVKRIHAINDSRINLVNVKHVGPANAKNIGINYVSGDYVLFVDSDDLISFNMFELVFEEIKKNDSDFIVFQWLPFKKKINDIHTSPKGMLTIDGMGTAVWNKVYSRKIIEKIKFPRNTVFEDVVFSVQAYLRANTVSFIEKPLYFYRQHANSITKVNYNPKRHLDIIKGISLLRDDMINGGFNISDSEHIAIGILIHKIIIAHMKKVLGGDVSSTEVKDVLQKLNTYILFNNKIFGKDCSRNRLENLKARFFLILVDLHLYKLAQIVLNWKLILHLKK